jgi:hypothetical protein
MKNLDRLSAFLEKKLDFGTCKAVPKVTRLPKIKKTGNFFKTA